MSTSIGETPAATRGGPPGPYARMRGPRATRARVLVLVASIAVGALATVQIKYALVLLLAACYLPLAVTDIGVALAVWVALPFLQGLSYLNLAGKAAGAVVAVGWIGLLEQRRIPLARTLAANRVACAALAMLSLWVTLSVAWASSPSAAVSDLWHWYAVALIFIIVASTATSPRLARLVAVAFVVGSVLSVAYGLAGGVSGAEAADPATYSGRLGGAIGDPNFLAAGVVPALVLTAALLASLPEVPRRLRPFAVGAAGLAALLLAVGLIKSESRGGLVAFAVAVILSLFAFPRQRKWVVSGLLILVAVFGVTLALNPSALQRFQTVGNGSGRTDEWTVALRMFRAHPVTGVGDANYVVVARDYTRRPGTLTEAQYLVSQPEVAHNTYLQLLSETGIVGLALLVITAAGCLRAGWVAAAKFRLAGDPALETLSRGMVIAGVAMLTASGFISAQVDQRLWTLLALGPALLTIAAAQAGRPMLGEGV
jgi:O-antigen ligase